MNLLPSLLLFIPFCYLVAALLMRRQLIANRANAKNKTSNINRGLSEGVAAIGVLLSLTVMVVSLFLGEELNNQLILFNSLTATMLVLISFIAWVILRFAKNYLDGDPRQQYFQMWFLAVMAAISLLVMTNHIILFFVAWVAVSLCLHPLLLYYPQRQKAVLAAHKKFLLSRLADALLLLSLALLTFSSQSLLISEILIHWSAATQLPIMIKLATLSLAVAAIIKCAQLPFHGWLLQVMEAPTPVSALLHAGIINIGGFLLLRFSDLLSFASAAQWLLLIVGTITAIIASLTLMTRISIKVMLAWSTCAQMGFMLMEIALGFYTLALLHLVAHSCYKAHSFLNSGEAVDQHIRRARYGSQGQTRGWHWLVSSVLVTVILGILMTSVGYWAAGTYVLVTIVAISLTIFIAESLRYPLQVLHGLILAGAAGIAILYLFNKQLFTLIGADLFSAAAVNSALVSQSGSDFWQAIVIICAFTLFFLLFIILRLRPNGNLSQSLYPMLYGGLYLDEWFSSTLLRYWPCLRSSPSPMKAQLDLTNKGTQI